MPLLRHGRQHSLPQRQPAVHTGERQSSGDARSLTNGDSRDKATGIHSRLACAFVRQSRPKAPLREPFLPLLAPFHAALPCGGGSSLHTPLTRRASGGQGCFQHYSTTERMMALCCGTVLEVSSPPEHFTHEKLCRVTRSGIMPRRPFSGVAAIYLRR